MTVTLRGSEAVIYCSSTPPGYYDRPDLTPLKFRWAWPENYQVGEHFIVFDCPHLYFNLGAWGIKGTATATTVRCVDETGNRDDAIWRVTGERHPTEDAVLAVWPD